MPYLFLKNIVWNTVFILFECRMYLVWMPYAFGSGKGLANYWMNLPDKVPHKKNNTCLYVYTYNHTRTHAHTHLHASSHAYTHTHTHKRMNKLNINTQTHENSAPCAMSIEEKKKGKTNLGWYKQGCACLNTHSCEHICSLTQVSDDTYVLEY